MSSIPEQISQLNNQLTRLSQCIEEIRQSYEQESFNTRQQFDTIQAELRQARELNETLQSQNRSLETRLAQRRFDTGSRRTLGVILHEDVRKANERLAHAREYDLISNSDVADDSISENQDKDGASLRTERDVLESENPTANPEGNPQETNATPGSSNLVGSEQNRPVDVFIQSSQPEASRDLGAGTSTTLSGTLPPDLVPDPDSFLVQSTTQRWCIRINKPAFTAKVKCGPMKWSQLPSKLGIDHNTVNVLKRSLSSDEHLALCLRMHENFAFVYDPIFLDDTVTPATYLFDWGRPEDNSSIARYIQEKGEHNGSTFHTFVYLLKPKRWYYVGVQEWTQTDLELDIWKNLSEQHDGQDRLRSQIIQRLHDHCGRNVEHDSIADLLDRGVLKQSCVHLSGDSHLDSSRAMCISMNYDSPAN